MNRRHFLKNGSLGALGLPALVSGSAFTKSPIGDNEISSESTPAAFALNEVTIDLLQQKMSSGVYTCQLVTDMYLKRIRAIDKNGPALGSVIEINPDAMAIAAAMDRERRTGKTRGPLHGVPVLIKDNIDTADKMMTTAGSLALEGNMAKADAFIVKQLRAAGAVLLGKTNLSEFANFRSTHSTSGWSSRGGQTSNPYVLARNTSGSSAGSGAAVAANLCAVAVGTETNGSIASPASINGIAGIKPTVGLVSRSGIIPISATQDTAGPMARTVKDAAILLGALSGVDSEDKTSLESAGKFHEDYTKFLDVNGLQGKKIGVDKSFSKGNEDVVALLKKALDLIKSKGATVIEVDLVSKIGDINNAEDLLLKYEFKDGLNRYLSKAGAKVKSLKEVIEFNRAHAAVAMPFFKQELLESAEEKGDLQNKEYTDALSKALSATRSNIDAAFRQYGLDALFGPNDGPAWCTDLVNGDFFTGNSYYGNFSIAGYPHVTVPAGFVHGLPVGICFMGTAYSEPELIRIAYAYEQASQKRAAPRFLNAIVR